MIILPVVSMTKLPTQGCLRGGGGGGGMKGDWRREGCIKGGAKSTAGGKGGRQGIHFTNYIIDSIQYLD